MTHLLLYDGDCGLCDRAVRFVLRRDTKNRFVFAPLQGKTAAKLMPGMPEAVKQGDTVVLIENFDTPAPRVSIRAKATLRVLWILGGGWALLGWLSFLPTLPWDLLYRLVAKLRGKVPACSSLPIKSDPKQPHKFLD